VGASRPTSEKTSSIARDTARTEPNPCFFAAAAGGLPAESALRALDFGTPAGNARRTAVAVSMQVGLYQRERTLPCDDSGSVPFRRPVADDRVGELTDKSIPGFVAWPTGFGVRQRSDLLADHPGQRRQRSATTGPPSIPRERAKSASARGEMSTPHANDEGVRCATSRAVV